MELADAVDFARTTRQSVLTTIRGNGRPQLSNVLHHVFDDGIIRISITADRAKYRNLSREPWAALHVTRDDFFAYVRGRAHAGAQPHDPTVDELVAHYQALMGEHENWDAYRKAMVTERRSNARFKPNRAYRVLELPQQSGS